MNANIHYTPTGNGFSIRASSEFFNRTLYGSHKNDDVDARYFTFAGDAPMFMGALTDWTKNDYSFHAKCGTLMSGVALTPGHYQPNPYSDELDQISRWFHNAEDIVAEYKNGWMEYELSQITPWFPNVHVWMQAYPLLPDDGFLIRYKISSETRILFAAGFGGVTDYISRLEYKEILKRYFEQANCEKNTIELGENRACVRHPNGCTMRIASSFSATFGLGSAKVMEGNHVGMFLGSSPESEDDAVVRISAEIEPTKPLEGYIIVLHNADEATLDSWLARKDPVSYIKQQIFAKFSCINVNTPQHPLDLTIAPTVIALDSSWHKNSFHHGTFGYHSPFLGWRNWYAPTALGWTDRVAKTMSAHLDQMVEKKEGTEEKVWFDGWGAREGDGPSQYHNIENSYGYLPYFLGETMAYYDMQECAFDMMMYYLQWSGDLELAGKYFDKLCALLDWEERIFDYDGDGLYQNFLNTWISDGHSYHGAGCAQASAYNYRANVVMAKIAKKLGKSDKVFLDRAEKIKKAVNEKLWIADSGVIAESLDTMGNCMLHPSPELSTTYLAIDCDVVDELKAYAMLKFTEREIKSITTPVSGGRLSYSSNWYPKKYSTCGIFPAENAHLALTYFKLGLKEEGKKLLDGIVDCYFTGKNPGMAAHVQSELCASDYGDLDFTDVSSTYLRAVVEGLFGIRFDKLDERVTIAPGFPADWEHASISLKDISLRYDAMGEEAFYEVCCDSPYRKVLRIPMGAADVECVMLDGEPVDYTVKAAPNGCFLMVETDKVGRFQLRVMYGNTPVPTLQYMNKVMGGSEICFEVSGGELVEVRDLTETLEEITVVGNTVYAKVKNSAGFHTAFFRVRSGEYEAWLAADYEVPEKKQAQAPIEDKPFDPVDISKYFNCEMMKIHEQEYLSPRPEGYSIGVFANGRYAWEWNHCGHNALCADDSKLRAAGGSVTTRSGIKFLTPAQGENVACVSLWDNFPTQLSIPLEGCGQELALMFISSTNCMQTQVENVRITVEYADGTITAAKLVYPDSIDDWMVPALQKENEIFYFSDFNHATVKRLRLDSAKKLASVKVEAIANEVIMGVMGVSIKR